MKRLLLLSLLLLPIFAYGEEYCKCDTCRCEEEEEEEDDGSYRKYNYFGLKSGNSHHYMQDPLVTSERSYGAYWGHRSSALFGYELEYTYMGPYETPTSEGHTRVFSLAGLHYYDFSKNFAMMGKFGLAYTKTADTALQGKDGYNFVAGVGFDWRMSKQIVLRVEYDYYPIKMNYDAHATNFYGGLAYIY